MTSNGPCPENEIARYTCYRTHQPIHVDGKIDEGLWSKAPKSARFVDMAAGTPGFFDTRMAALWDDENLYIRFWIEEPFVEAYHSERDSIVFQENDVESGGFSTLVGTTNAPHSNHFYQRLDCWT